MKNKEQILKELKKKDFLSQSIMLNWLRSQTNITFSKEERFNKLLKDMIIEEVEEAITQTREETIREGIEQIEDLRKAIANQVGFRYDEHYENCIYILNKLKK